VTTVREHAWRIPAALMLAAILAGCGQDQNKTLNMPIVCETENCSCQPQSGYVKKSPEVKWNTDGTAYCPEGFNLTLPPTKSMRLTVGPGIS
jgi:hypothetical protein